MELARLQNSWTNLGRKDPLWAILSDPSARHGKWDMDSFLRTGVEMIHYLQRHLQGLGVAIELRRALDFGCGYGRLTQALATRFSDVVGVDIAPTMLAGAQSIDRSDGRCQFRLNDTPDLRQFGDDSFDFVLTLLVLQHMRPQYSAAYVREFLRVLRPGGIAFFQIPSEPFPVAAARPFAGEAPIAQSLSDLRATLSAHPGAPMQRCGEWRYFRLQLRNVGRHAWTATGPRRVRVASRWHNPEGTPGGAATFHDLPHDVDPAQGLALLVPVRAPSVPVLAVLQFLVVIDDTWVESVQHPPARQLVQVLSCAPSEADPAFGATPPPPPRVSDEVRGPAHADEAEIEVHGIAVPAMVEIVRQNGGIVLDVAEDNWAGPDWLSAHYTVRKA